MDKICKFCGQPVRVNEEYYDVFEGMHWLCFHLSFEHGDYDPDEPCDDPSCPWNRIGESYFFDYENKSRDVKIVALNNHQLIEMKLADWETDRLPSVAIQMGLLGGAVGYKSKRVWYTLADVEQFITSLTIINERVAGKAALRGMSPNQFDIEVENIDSRGHFVLKYGIGFHEYIGDTRLESFISSGFEIDLQTIDRMAQGLDKMKSKIGLAKEGKE
jgi:hypothetical protein